ncbi:hypothetical protein V6N13_143384 [Hibiscus sabdariffa]|uniref:Uncharacterized protein n=1 Tax=Hibiscus sabdariffa TaxID=183260 RepID=A0ABR2FH57_9ROSI
MVQCPGVFRFRCSGRQRQRPFRPPSLYSFRWLSYPLITNLFSSPLMLVAGVQWRNLEPVAVQMTLKVEDMEAKVVMAEEEEDVLVVVMKAILQGIALTNDSQNEIGVSYIFCEHFLPGVLQGVYEQ